MQRRLALKNLGLLTSGILFLPSCNFSEEMATIALNSLNISKKQEDLLTEIVATLLPKGTLKGGKTIGVHNFVWVIIDDCAKKEDQKTFVNGLDEFKLKAKKIHKDSFSNLSSEKKEKFISSVLNDNKQDTDLVKFLSNTKSLAIRGYKLSEYYMTEIMPFSLVPGTFSNCETIDANHKINTNA